MRRYSAFRKNQIHEKAQLFNLKGLRVNNLTALEHGKMDVKR
jgi:hypothetical protein